MRRMMIRMRDFVGIWCLLLLACGITHGADYDPLSVPAQVVPDIVNLTVKDLKRQRDIPIRAYLPLAIQAAPVVMFSHGLGGSREGNSYLGKHWAARGYVTVFLQHPGSDSHVWQDVPRWRRMQSMRNAASTKNFLLRGKALFTDTRIAAAVIMSPSSPKRGTPQTAFGKVSLPWILMTGTKDTALIGGADMKSRLSVFPALPRGGKYELVLFGAEHSGFTDQALPGDTEPRNPNHHRVILALSTAFWDAYLLDNLSAQQWLDGNGPKSILQDNDRWQMK